jgi:hypothetical protein
MFEPMNAPLEDYATADNELLAELDGTSYHKVELVIKRRSGQYQGVYCDYRHWPQSAAGRIAHANAVIAFQQTMIEELAQRVSANDEAAERLPSLVGSAVALSAENLMLRRQADTARAEAEALRVAIAALQSELVRAIDGNTTSYERDQAEERSELDQISDSLAIAEDYNAATIGRPEPADDTPITCRYGCGESFHSNAGRGSHERRKHGHVWREIPIVAIDPIFRCVMCDSDAFAQSISQPDRCIRCANKTTLNGHAQAVA